MKGPGPDAVVVGSGPNGLTAGICAAREGWDVLVLEAADRPGGAVRSDELTLPGVVHDTFSSFHPLAKASPVLRSFRLEEVGLEWAEAPLHNAHPGPDGRTAVMCRDVADTAEHLDTLSSGEGDAWRDFVAIWHRIEEPFLAQLMSPVPDVTAATRIAWRLRDRLPDLMRTLISSVETLGEDHFSDPATHRMLTGLALHSDLAPEAPGSGLAGAILAWVGQSTGWPTPRGGAGKLAEALVRRLEGLGGEVRCRSRVARISVRAGRAVAAVLEDGTEIPARRAVLGDVSAPALLTELVGEEHLPDKVRSRLGHFRWGSGVFKVDWTIREGIPWSSPEARDAGTVHLGDSNADMSRYANEVHRSLIPRHPYLLLGQTTVADPTRAPAGLATVWGYTHVPASPRGDAEGDLTPGWPDATEGFADRLEARIEELAPGFRERIVARHVMTPPDLQARNANLVNGDIAGGSFALTQQLVFRPLPGLWRYRMPVRGLYLCSASAHPGGGVHGGPGAAAWSVVRRDARLRRI